MHGLCQLCGVRPSASPAGAVLLPQTLNICCAGDVKLSELKAALSKKGISADFVAGSLLCADSILVRRTDDDSGLVLEGPLSDDFYTVRSTLYALYKVC